MASIIIGLGNKCIDAFGANTADGTAIILWEQKILGRNSSGLFLTSNQLWNYDPITGYLESTMNPMQCLDIAHGDFQNGTPIILWQKHGGENQKWNIDADGCISNRTHPNMCIDVRNATNNNGTPLVLWEKNGGANQRWTLTDSNNFSSPSFLLALATLLPTGTSESIIKDVHNQDIEVLERGLTSNIVIHVVASAVGNPAPRIEVSGTLSWKCSSNHSQIVSLHNEPIEFINNPVSSASSLDVSTKPLNQIAKICTGLISGLPQTKVIEIRGTIVIVATNLYGIVSSTKFNFDYLDMPN